MAQVVNKKLILSNTLYNILKMVIQVIVPAALTLFVALAAIWKIPDVDQIVGSVTAVATFVGLSLHISTANYVSSGAAYNGTISIAPNASGSTLSMHIDPADVVGKDVISLQVVAPKSTVVPDVPPSVGSAPSRTNPPAS